MVTYSDEFINLSYTRDGYRKRGQNVGDPIPETQCELIDDIYAYTCSHVLSNIEGERFVVRGSGYSETFVQYARQVDLSGDEIEPAEGVVQERVYYNLFHRGAAEIAPPTGWYFTPDSGTLTINGYRDYDPSNEPKTDLGWNAGALVLALVTGTSYQWEEDTSIGNPPFPSTDADPACGYAWNEPYIPWSALTTLGTIHTLYTYGWVVGGSQETVTIDFPQLDGIIDGGLPIQMACYTGHVGNQECPTTEIRTNPTYALHPNEYLGGDRSYMRVRMDWTIQDEEPPPTTTTPDTISVPRLHVPHKFYESERAKITERELRG